MEEFFFFFIYICRITEFTVVPNTKHGLQSREPRACTEHPQLQRGFLAWWSGCSPIYRCTPTHLHISNSLTLFTFLSGKNREVLVFSSWRGAHYNTHVIHLSIFATALTAPVACITCTERRGKDFAMASHQFCNRLYSCRTSYHTWEGGDNQSKPFLIDIVSNLTLYPWIQSYKSVYKAEISDGFTSTNLDIN